VRRTRRAGPNPAVAAKRAQIACSGAADRLDQGHPSPKSKWAPLPAERPVDVAVGHLAQPGHPLEAPGSAPRWIQISAPRTRSGSESSVTMPARRTGSGA